jgi:hypothetical protein
LVFCSLARRDLQAREVSEICKELSRTAPARGSLAAGRAQEEYIGRDRSASAQPQLDGTKSRTIRSAQPHVHAAVRQVTEPM